MCPWTCDHPQEHMKHTERISMWMGLVCEWRKEYGATSRTSLFTFCTLKRKQQAVREGTGKALWRQSLYHHPESSPMESFSTKGASGTVVESDCTGNHPPFDVSEERGCSPGAMPRKAASQPGDNTASSWSPGTAGCIHYTHHFGVNHLRAIFWRCRNVKWQRWYSGRTQRSSCLLSGLCLVTTLLVYGSQCEVQDSSENGFRASSTTITYVFSPRCYKRLLQLQQNLLCPLNTIHSKLWVPIN